MDTYADKLRAIADKLDRQSKEASAKGFGTPERHAGIINAQSEAMGELFAVLWAMYREAVRTAVGK